MCVEAALHNVVSSPVMLGIGCSTPMDRAIWIGVFKEANGIVFFRGKGLETLCKSQNCILNAPYTV